MKRRVYIRRLSRNESRALARRFGLLSGLILLVSVGLVAVIFHFAPNRPIDYDTEQDHFYYGSIGSDIANGLPSKVLLVLPKVCADHLPQRPGPPDYTRFGFIQESGHALPIGFSTRRMIVDQSWINCAACHTGSVRGHAGADPNVIPGMPANTTNFHDFLKFMFNCAADDRFNYQTIFSAMQSAGLAGPLDGLIYRLLIPRMKAQLLARRDKLSLFVADDYPPFGPGRGNTFDTFKFDQFAPYYAEHHIPIDPGKIYGTVDFPPVWNQGAREGLKLNWDGNNTSIVERAFSAAIGAGTLPQDMDLQSLYRTEAWLRTLPPPAYPYGIDVTMAAHGARVYGEHCAQCHSPGGQQVGQVTPLDQIGTDRYRMDAYTPAILDAQKDYAAGYSWAFTHFSKTDGYANQPLDGIWARAPYLHNGSVPSMWWLLAPQEQRPSAFTAGSDVYDPQQMGFQSIPLQGDARSGYTQADGTPYTGSAFVFDTHLKGNGNFGHSGPRYGTDLPETDKLALIEYFKWQDRPS